MKAQRFEVGQAITPNHKDWIVLEGSDKGSVLPKFGEIYHVKCYGKYWSKYGWFMEIDELSVGAFYSENGFDPVVDSSVIESEIIEIFNPIEAC